MSDLTEAAEIVRREDERIAGKWLAMHASDATPRTRHIPPPAIWPALLFTASLLAGLVIAIATIAAQAA